MTAMVSHKPSFRTMPSAPSAQFTGAIFAPAQIHICCGPVESRSASGIGSTLWMSALNSLFAGVVMRVPLVKTVLGGRNPIGASGVVSYDVIGPDAQALARLSIVYATT